MQFLLEFKDYVKVTAYNDKIYRVLSRALNGEGESYIHNIAEAFFKNAQVATSQDEFIKLMLRDGIQTDWQDEYSNIMFIDVKRREAGEKYYRIGTNKLQKYYNLDFSKEGLIKTFLYNTEMKNSEKNTNEKLVMK